MKKNTEKQKIAFLDRDGVLIYEPQDTKQIDSLEKLEILPNVIAGLKILLSSGYKLVMVSNQDGLGTKSFPTRDFEVVQNKLLEILQGQGISFYKIFICPHFEKDKCNCRKPKTGLLEKFLKEENIDIEKSFVVGDRKSDEELAKNIGVKFYQCKVNGTFPRLATIERKTKETEVSISCNLDGQGIFSIDTGINFFNHMLEQLSKHSLVDLDIKANGDLKVDDHHTIEDVGITLGETLLKALGERKGIKRYGFLLPMDDTLVEVAIDLGGRPYLVFNCDFKREKVGDLPTEMVEHFFRSVAESLKANIHINVKYSKNEHHKIEAIFKAFAKSSRMAVEADYRQKNKLPSTKGIL
ncbi:MAG: bifunctional histidinol-phosphatase/imidazoleglycerol-phosphate dehydratase HisB [bacterium]|nr:bifunctional histidinol-phosphatase/imidazoleglycerol-phosphate dehydratase HisB [bacterium]